MAVPDVPLELILNERTDYDQYLWLLPGVVYYRWDSRVQYMYGVGATPVEGQGLPAKPPVPPIDVPFDQGQFNWLDERYIQTVNGVHPDVFGNIPVEAITGPPGPAGASGAPGAPGPAGPGASDSDFAAYLNNPTSSTRAALTSAGNTPSGSGFMSWAGTVTGSVPVVKPSGDARPGVWEMTNNSESGYLFHLLLGANAGHNTTALIALGVDNDGIGLLVPNKQKGRGIVGDQRATVTATDAYWLHATQRSPGSPLVRLEMQANDAAPLLQMLAFGTPGSDQKLLYIGDPTGQAGVINAADGSIEWRRNVTVQDPASGTGTSAIGVTSNNGVAAASRQHTRHVKDGIEYYNPTGTAGTWWPFKIAAGGSHLQFRAGGSTSNVGTLPTMVNMIDVQNGKLSFFGATAVAQQTGMGAAATDATTTQTLVNNLRTALINLGLVTA